MHGIPFLSSVTAGALVLAAAASPAAGQTDDIPTISGRYFASGSAKVKVSGSVQINQEVPINTKASFGDGESTWLQFGVSGATDPNALLTFQPQEVGVTVGKGKFIVTAGVTKGEKPQCSGKTDVDATSVTGHYTCPGIDSYDAATGKMGKVDIEITFAAKS